MMKNKKFCRIILLTITGMMVSHPVLSELYEVPKVLTDGWYDYGYAPGKLSMPPSGIGRIVDWHETWPGHETMYLTPSQCSSIGQNLIIRCHATSCGGGFDCKKESICPAGSDEINGKCYRETNECVAEGAGNPCDPATGKKFQSEIDYQSTGLSIARYYNSTPLKDDGFGVGWTMPFGKRIQVSLTTLGIERAKGTSEIIKKINGQWVGDPDTNVSVSENASGWLITNSDASTEQYDIAGKLLSETESNGTSKNYTYNTSGLIVNVTDHFGRAISISWNSFNHIVSVTDPGGNIYGYHYDSKNNLIKVDYPDGGSRIYHYENSSYPSHLTGITDENGDRYATFVYDSQGRAISTEHADVGNGVQEKFSIDYTQ